MKLQEKSHRETLEERSRHLLEEVLGGIPSGTLVLLQSKKTRKLLKNGENKVKIQELTLKETPGRTSTLIL